jgi:hypothetical protein
MTMSSMQIPHFRMRSRSEEVIRTAADAGEPNSRIKS